MATFITAAVVALIVGAALWKIISDKRSGKHSCCGDCAKCKGCH